MEKDLPVAERAEIYQRSIQTPDSWARSIIEIALEAAKEEAGKTDDNLQVTIPAEIKIKICKAGDSDCNGGTGGTEICITLKGKTACLLPFPFWPIY